MCFRSRSGLHRVPEGRHSDARRSPVGGALLLHAAAARTGQSGEAFAAFLINITLIIIIIIIFTQARENCSSLQLAATVAAAPCWQRASLFMVPMRFP